MYFQNIGLKTHDAHSYVNTIKHSFDPVINRTIAYLPIAKDEPPRFFYAVLNGTPIRIQQKFAPSLDNRCNAYTTAEEIILEKSDIPDEQCMRQFRVLMNAILFEGNSIVTFEDDEILAKTIALTGRQLPHELENRFFFSTVQGGMNSDDKFLQKGLLCQSEISSILKKFNMKSMDFFSAAIHAQCDQSIGLSQEAIRKALTFATNYKELSPDEIIQFIKCLNIDDKKKDIIEEMRQFAQPKLLLPEQPQSRTKITCQNTDTLLQNADLQDQVSNFIDALRQGDYKNCILIYKNKTVSSTDFLSHLNKELSACKNIPPVELAYLVLFFNGDKHLQSDIDQFRQNNCDEYLQSDIDSDYSKAFFAINKKTRCKNMSAIDIIRKLFFYEIPVKQKDQEDPTPLQPDQYKFFCPSWINVKSSNNPRTQKRKIHHVKKLSELAANADEKSRNRFFEHNGRIYKKVQKLYLRSNKIENLQQAWSNFCDSLAILCEALYYFLEG